MHYYINLLFEDLFKVSSSEGPNLIFSTILQKYKKIKIKASALTRRNLAVCYPVNLETSSLS